jgi:histidinol-phosphate aminotransferase
LSGPKTFEGLNQTQEYSVSRHPASTDLKLDANEGPAPPAELLAAIKDLPADTMNRYAKATSVEQVIANRIGIDPARVLVTAGGDDAIDRVCRAYLAPDREMILPQPTFEMFQTFGQIAGGRIIEVPWPKGVFPTSKVLEAVTDRTGMIVVVSPNNPTGATATAGDLRELSKNAPDVLILADLVYASFADENLLEATLDLPNVIGIHSFSKAWGMAGLRVGYATGPADMIGVLRKAGAPYPVSTLSQALAKRWFVQGEKASGEYADRVKIERTQLFDLLTKLGASPYPSQANFVFSQFADPTWARDALAGLGIAVRLLPINANGEKGVRISCPSNPKDYDRLEKSLQITFAPEAILFDMDGVLADDSQSYRASVVETAKSFGVTITMEQVAKAKTELNANNEWDLTQRMCASNGVQVDLDEVTDRFEQIYQGTKDTPGLKETEKLLVDRAWLVDLAKRYPLAIVTGRPRADSDWFLEKEGIADLFQISVCMEDAPLKPNPAPVKLALERLGIDRAWMIGDTPDDITAARKAGVLPIGVTLTPGSAPNAAGALLSSGAARVLTQLRKLEELLP